MSSTRPKSKASGAGSRVKGQDKNNDSPSHVESDAESGHPDDISPMVLTSATQELFGCRTDEDVTGENPYKLLRKDDIIQDIKTRAAVSDFSPVKQIVLDYPEDEILLVFDRDFTYGQSFYLVLTPEAKDRILSPPEAEEKVAVEDETSEVLVDRSPEPKPWVSLGSEQEIEEESFKESREKLRYRFSKVRRKFGAPVCFSDQNMVEACFIECRSYQDPSFSIKRMERHCGVQAVSNLQSSSTQTQWKYPKNMWTQYEPRESTEEEKKSILQSESLKKFINTVAPRFELAIQQNDIMDVFFDDWGALSVDSGFGEKTDTHLKQYQSFTDLHSKEKTISQINWHPTINGVIAVAMMERRSLEEQIDNSTKLLLNPSLILFWSFSDPINPQLLLECPDDVLAFEFCPSDPNIIVGSCKNGQVVLWDISAHVEHLQGTRPGAGKNISVNADVSNVFEEKEKNETPVVRYCAVSAIENSHKAPITDVQWLPETFEVTRMGVPVENKNKLCVQLVTCAPNCSVMFWDIRAARAATQPTADRKQKVEEMPLENPHGDPNTFRHLNLTWKPLVRFSRCFKCSSNSVTHQVALPRIDTSGEYSPLKFSLECNTCDSHTGRSTDRAHLYADRSEVNPEYGQLRVPSAKTLKTLEDINTKFYVGTEDGELVYTDWKLEKDSDSGRLYSAKPSHCFTAYDWLVHTVQRSPFFKDIILTVGGWNFAIWKEGVMAGPIVKCACSQNLTTFGCWSRSRPAVFFIGKEDGNIEVWNLLEKIHEPSHVQNITTDKITCIKPWIVSSKQHFLAVSDDLGTVHILEIPWTLRSPSNNEKLNVRKYFDKEVERVLYFEKRREMRTQEKRDMEAEELRKKMEAVMPPKSMEQIEEEASKEYEEYLALEKTFLKKMGLVQDADSNTLDI